MKKPKLILFISLIIFGEFANSQEFTIVKNTTIDSVYYGSVSCGDYNNDHFLDILITGITKDYNIESKIYKNNHNDSFTEQKDIHLTGVFKSSNSFIDYNNDGLLDVVITGRNSVNFTKIYKNNGNGNYSEQKNIVLHGGENGKLNWGDFNNDNFPDLIITGENNGHFIKIYKNNKGKDFTELKDLDFPNLKKASVDWGDYNNDGYLDFVVSGQDSNQLGVCIIYKNVNNKFIKQSDILLKGLYNGLVKWKDYDNDHKLDLFITGRSGNKRYSKIYKNYGNNTFKEQTEIVIDGIENGSVDWGDYDNDGLIDILLTGESDSGRISKIYKNDGHNHFIEQKQINLLDLRFSDSKWGDYDNDGDLDIILTGQSHNNKVILQIYKNNKIKDLSMNNLR